MSAAIATSSLAAPTKEEAESIFLTLVSRHGLQWNASVPQSAHEQLARANAVLTADDRRRLALRRGR
jgi:hypothetical protein